MTRGAQGPANLPASTVGQLFPGPRRSGGSVPCR